MNFNHLEYAIAVSKHGSISRAAQYLFLSQPYLSSMIKSLEEELGYKIFERTSSGITLTPEGEMFIRSARRILRELETIRRLPLSGEEQGLNIASYYATYIMDMFLKFRTKSPSKLPDKIKEMGNREVIEAIAADDSPLGIIFYADERRTQYQKMIEEFGLQLRELLPPMETYVICAPPHPLASAEGISIEELKQYPYVSYDDPSSRRYLSLLGIENHPQLLEVSDRGSFYDALKSGRYLSVMAYHNLPDTSDITVLPFLGKKKYLLSGYITARDHRLTKREREFLRYLKMGKFS